MQMEHGHFYFISDRFYIDFPDEKLMRNKEAINGFNHDRHCFFAFPAKENPNLFWCIPISSKVEKYEALYARKVEKHHKCNTIRFGNVMGMKRAFLIQNMFPVTAKYIASVYLDKNTKNEVTINPDIEKDIVTNARDVLKLYRRGIPLIFPDILVIEKQLLIDLQCDLVPKVEVSSLSDRLTSAHEKAQQLNTHIQQSKKICKER